MPESTHKKRTWKTILIHAFFWILSFYILLRIFVRGNEIESIDIIYTVLFQFTVAPFAYLNLLLFKPFINSKRWSYYLYLIILVFAGAEFNYLFFNNFIDFLLPGYYFISYYEFKDIVQFIFGHLFILMLLQLSFEWFELNKEQRRISEIEREKIEHELKALLSQLNPHFLFNTLNSLYSMVLGKKEQSADYILKLADVLRYVIYHSKRVEIPMEEEIKLLKDYILLQELRMDNPNVNFQIGGKSEWAIPPMLFLPLLENAFKHGLKDNRGQADKNKIDIRLEIADKELLFLMKNRKAEAEEKFINEQGGIGIETIRRRLDLLFPERYEFDAKNEGQEFVTRLRIWKT